MNTVQDLREEFDRLAAQAPDGVAVRAAVARQAALAARRRRTLSLVAVAASVVVVIGGAAAAVSVLGDRGAGTAAIDAAGSDSASDEGGALQGGGADNEPEGVGEVTSGASAMSSASATSGVSAASSLASPTSGHATALEPPAAAATAMTLARGPNSSPAPPHTLVAGAVNDPDAAAVSWTASVSEHTARLDFALSNVTDEDVWIKEVAVGALGMTQSTPGLGDFMVIPANVSAMVSVNYAVDCAVLTSGYGADPDVELLFYAEDVWWAKRIVIDDGGFLRFVQERLCQ